MFELFELHFFVTCLSPGAQAGKLRPLGYPLDTGAGGKSLQNRLLALLGVSRGPAEAILGAAGRQRGSEEGSRGFRDRFWDGF